jgi:hypothetical protein
MTKSSTAFAFYAAALIFLAASPPLSAETSDRLAASARSVIQAKLLEPLHKKEEDRSRFSRAVTPPHARRIRILDTAPRADGQGRPFLSFAVDETRSFGEADETDWFKDAIMGCIYPETGEVMVRRGEVYYAASIMLGRPTPTARNDVCLDGG